MNKFTIVSDEVTSAIAKKNPIVALESTIISHGMPFPQNEQTALEVEDIVRSNGATPATVAVIKGKLKVGLNRSEIKDLSTKPDIIKMSKSNLYTGILRNQTGSSLRNPRLSSRSSFPSARAPFLSTRPMGPSFHALFPALLCVP